MHVKRGTIEEIKKGTLMFLNIMIYKKRINFYQSKNGKVLSQAHR